ncbi:uncharacterized protein LOC110021763 isoform X2 [Phalaenopsis equestris]|uniref:uncharacterized protein LOC110021763 isoform X2 n=1 Tax=Phalaenopsis equestris TaxID=78828 RepID=UPI0009E5FB09|nr:uncharacterized protein LOC110021763 isoform X2 [Phalaenopsis equestris]
MHRSDQDHVATKRPRRSVQSKLSFCASSPIRGSRAAAAPLTDAVAEDGGRNSEGREEEGNRKRKAKLKSQNRSPEESADNDKEAQELSGYRRKSNRNSKNMQYGGETPKKNKAPRKLGHSEACPNLRILNGKSDDVKDSIVESLPFCDLWSEAKIAAEENLRLSAGKQTHPFFSICRTINRSSPTKSVEKSENRIWLGLEGDRCFSFPPFHVFDAVQDDVAVPNWENWKFLETSLPKFDGCCSMKNSSVFEVSNKSLLLEAARGKDERLDILVVDEKMNGAYKTISSSKFSSELLLKEKLSSPSKMAHFGCNFSRTSPYVSIAHDGDQDEIHNERLASYSKQSICCVDCSLWTEKYRPKLSSEVCGNVESVKLLSDWLKSWDERVLPNATNGNRRNHSSIEDGDYKFHDHESDTDELDGGDLLKTVLLITGPVGSGKSAAIYACAREQGFKVIEVNASVLRNGAFVRQTFGEGVDSLGLTHWLTKEQTNQQSKDVQELKSCMSIIAENGLEADSIKMDSKLFCIDNAAENSSHFDIANKTLFLFEEVDVVFDEDHGFISTIFKLAETTKRPIILTSNSKRPVLPHKSNRLVLDFKVPSSSELLYHASMVCALEKVHVSCGLLEHIIKACVGDIRRILLLLQFWCQGFQGITGKMTQCTKSPVPFDIDAVHLAIPRVFPWNLRCELSERMEEEISKVVIVLEKNSIINELLQLNFSLWETDDPSEKLNATPAVKSRKKGRLRKQSITGHSEFSDHMTNLGDLLYDSDSPSTCLLGKTKQKPCVVLSSESDDGLSFDEVRPIDISTSQKSSFDELNHEDSLTRADSHSFLAITASAISKDQEHGIAQLDQMDEPRNALVFQNSFDITEVASTSHVCNASRRQFVDACTSESSVVSGTEKNFTFFSQEVSQNSVSTSSYGLNISALHPGLGLNNADGDSTELSKCLEYHVSTADVHKELLQRNQEIVCFQNEHRPNECQLAYNCTNPDFSAQLMHRDGTECPHDADSISQTWKRLRSCHHENLKLLSSNYKDVSLVASLTSGLADLISEADIMFSNCSPITCDNFEPTSIPCVEPDSFSWHDEQVEMGSTFAQHGLCFYATKIAAVGSRLGCSNTSDLARETLTSSTGSTALGKLLTRESITGQNSCFKDSGVKASPSLIPVRRELAADLYNAILPIVPARLSMVIQGVAFHEYLSYVGQISRFECSRLADRFVETNKRRTRLHYLSSGAHQLSSGQTALLARRTCFTGSSCL